MKKNVSHRRIGSRLLAVVLAVLLMLPIQTMVFASDLGDDIVVVYADADETPAETPVLSEPEAEEPGAEDEDGAGESEVPAVQDAETRDPAGATADSLDVPESPAAITNNAEMMEAWNAYLASGEEEGVFLIGESFTLSDSLTASGREQSMKVTFRKADGATNDELIIRKGGTGGRHISVTVSTQLDEPIDLTFDFEGIVLDGNGLPGGIRLYGSSSIANTVHVAINGATVQNGRTSSSSLHGAIEIQRFTGEGSTVELNDVKLLNNHFYSTGGVYIAYAGSARINGGRIAGNSTSTVGGGVYSSNLKLLEIYDTEIEGNKAHNDAKGVNAHSGGIYLTATEQAVIGGSTRLVGNSVYTGRVYMQTSGIAGAVYVTSNSKLTIQDDVYIANNTSRYDGGAIYVNGHASGNLENLEIRGNVVFENNSSTDSSAYYLNNEEDAALHARQIDPSVTWSHDEHSFQFLYNNYDISYIQGDTEPPDPPEPRVLITNEATLRAYWTEMMNSGVDEFTVPIHADEITLTGSTSMRVNRAVQVSFVIDEDFEPAGDSVTIRTTSAIRHIETSSGATRGGTMVFEFDGVVLDGGGIGGGIVSSVSVDDLVLRGAVIQNCVATSTAASASSKYSAAFRGNADSSVLIEDVKILNNQAPHYAGGISLNGGMYCEMVIRDSQFIGNAAADRGGAAYITAARSSLEIYNCEFDGNTAVNGGGALFVTEPYVMLVDGNRFTDNHNTGTRADSSATGNYSQRGGGAIAVAGRSNSTTSSAFVITGDNLFQGNSAATNGGALAVDYIPLVIAGDLADYEVNCTAQGRENMVVGGNGSIVIEGNSANLGGALYIKGSAGTVADNVTIRENSATNGGGVYSSSVRVTFGGNAQVLDNTAEQDGGGMWGSLNTIVANDNVVFSGNTASQAYQMTNASHIKTHDTNVADTVTWSDGFEYLFNNYDFRYIDGDPIDPNPQFKIVDEQTLRQAIQEGIESGEDEIVLPIAVEKIVLGATIDIRPERGVTLVFTTDEGVERAVITTSGTTHHMRFYPVGDTTIDFDNVVLDGNKGDGGLYFWSTADSLTVNNLTLQNVRATASGVSYLVTFYNRTGHPTVFHNARILDNYASNSNHIFFHSGDGVELTFQGGEFSRNQILSLGAGAIYHTFNSAASAAPSTITLDGTLVEKNQGIYGAIYANNASLILKGDTVVRGNRGQNGMINVFKSTQQAEPISVTVTDNAVISDNVVYTTNVGGGISTQRANVTIDANARITGNSTLGNGGGISVATGSTLLVAGNAQITGNTAARNGGGIHTDSLATLEIRGNAVVADNLSAQGYYLWDLDDVALHAQQIDDTVTWTEGFDYVYNNNDVVYAKGSLEPVAPAEAISLNVAALSSMRKGAIQQLVSSVAPSNAVQLVTWTSSNENVLSVDENGLVTAHKVGSAIVTCTSYDGSVTKKVTIRVSA